jgi:hypothetical protein
MSKSWKCNRELQFRNHGSKSFSFFSRRHFMAQHASGQQSGSSKASWLDRAIDIVKPQPGAPPRPAAPSVHEGEWHKSVERKEVVPGLTVHDVGLSVFGETKSLHDRPGSDEPIDAARQKVAHTIINGAE